MTTSVSRGYASRIPSATRSPERPDGGFVTHTDRSSVPQLLQDVDDALELLRARGFPAGTQLLAQRYAGLLASRALKLDGPRGNDRHPEEGPFHPEEGYHARDEAGVRHWIVGRREIRGRGSRKIPPVLVPGVPDRAFDRLVLTRFDPSFEIEFAGATSASAFLRAAEYDDGENEWVLPSIDAFWTGPEVEDLTTVFRLTALHLDPVDVQRPRPDAAPAPPRHPPPGP